MSKDCTVWLLSDKTVNNETVKFPIVDYSNVYYNHASSLQDTIDLFLTYNHSNEGTDKFTNISSIDFSKCYFKVETSFKNANSYNYCVIRDNNENKYYCCFIKSVTWDSNLIVATFNFEIDIFHTYIKTISFKKCFVEREHVDNDTFGKHVLDEGIGVSDYFMFGSSNISTATDFIPVVAISDTSLLRLGTTIQGGTVPDIVNVNRFEKTICLVAPNSDTVIDPQIGVNGITAWTNFLHCMYDNNKGQSIVAMYYMPSSFLSSHFQVASFDPNLPDSGTDEPREPVYVTKNVTSNPSTESYTNQKPSVTTIHNISGYGNVPINNNKTLIYPYCFCELSNNNGGKLQLKYELSTSSNHNIVFTLLKSVCHGGKPYIFTNNYEGITNNFNHSLTALENPDLPYIHDSYGAYISSQRNALNNTIEYIKSDKDLALFNNNIDTVQTESKELGGMLGGALSLNLPSYANNLVKLADTEIDYSQTVNNIKYSAHKSMASVNAVLRDAKTRGNTASGVACCNSLLGINAFGFKHYTCVASPEELTTIDNYFSKFGYKVNDYKIPELKSRRYFNYVKCSEVNLVGNVPSNHLNIMKAIFSSGVTLWHNLDKMYDFDFANNTIVS